MMVGLTTCQCQRARNEQTAELHGDSDRGMISAMTAVRAWHICILCERVPRQARVLLWIQISSRMASLESGHCLVGSSQAVQRRSIV